MKEHHKQEFTESATTYYSMTSVNHNTKQVDILFDPSYPFQEMMLLQKLFGKAVRGRMHMEDSTLTFTPYKDGQNPPTVQYKEQVGDIRVKRTPRTINFSLSLPTTMSQSLMCLSILDQTQKLVDALRCGLYERMVGEQDSATNASSRAA